MNLPLRSLTAFVYVAATTVVGCSTAALSHSAAKKVAVENRRTAPSLGM